MYHRRRTFKRKRNVGKKRNFKRKRFGSRKFKKRGGFASRVKAVVMKQLTADSSWVVSYADIAASAGTINVLSQQLLWASNQTLTGGIAADQQLNLHMDRPKDLDVISTSIVSGDTIRFTRKTTVNEVHISNLSTGPIWFWEYRCQSRKDSLISPHVTLTDGYSDAATGLGGALAATTIGATPFMNPRFVAQNKILKVKKRYVNVGKSFMIRYSLKKPKQFNRENFAPNAVPWVVQRGDRFSVFCIQGTFAANSAASAGQTAGIGTAQVGLVFKKSYHYSWISDVSGERGQSELLYGFTPGNTTATSGKQPMPIISTHPDSAIAVGAAAAGDRVFDSVATTRYATQQQSQI